MSTDSEVSFWINGKVWINGKHQMIQSKLPLKMGLIVSKYNITVFLKE